MMERNRQQTRPNNTPRTRRPHDVMVGTTLPPGKVVPLAMIPLLREDSAAGVLNMTFEMMETHEILMNGVEVRVMAYCVPWLAMERFKGSREEFDLAYAGKAGLGGVVIPFFELEAMGTHGSNLVYKYLGIHGNPTDMVNTMPVEAYNEIDDFRRKNRNEKLTKRTRLQKDLAAAYWDHSRFAALVQDWDDAATDMEVPLTVRRSDLRVRGIGFNHDAPPGVGNAVAINVRESGRTSPRNTNGQRIYANGATAGAGISSLVVQSNGGYPEIWAEMADDGITVSLANIERAKKTKAFAELRKKFDQIDEDHIIDMLMDGLTVPEQHLKQPFLLGQAKAEFQQIKRYSTDADDLDRSAVSGGVRVTLPIRCPSIPTGGLIMVLAEIVPNQLFERQRDPFVHITNARYNSSGDLKDLPSYVRDELDEQKVDIVLNGQIDTAHSQPTVPFAYAPMNWEWAAMGPKMGGDFYRPTANTTTDTTRLNLWAVETPDPTYGETFQRVGTMHRKVFLDETLDPFRAKIGGTISITGLTVFGPALIENAGNWDEVEDMGPEAGDQIDK